VADNNVSRNLLENCNFVLVPQNSLATFVVEKHNVVSNILLVVRYDLGAALAKGLDDLSRYGWMRAP